MGVPAAGDFKVSGGLGWPGALALCVCPSVSLAG